MTRFLTPEWLGITISLILSIGSIISAYFYGYKPIKCTEDFEKLEKAKNEKTKELLELYKDVYCLIQIQAFLCEEADISKIKAREGFTISRRCEKKYIEKRMSELEIQIK